MREEFPESSLTLTVRGPTPPLFLILSRSTLLLLGLDLCESLVRVELWSGKSDESEINSWLSPS